MTVPIVLAGVWAVSGIVGLAMLIQAFRHPYITPTDDYCSSVDDDLAELERTASGWKSR